MSENAQTLDTFLQSRLDEYIRETAQLCAQPSVSTRGEGMHECAQLVAHTLARHSLQVQQFETPGFPVVVGRAEGRSPRTLLFYNHYDVQPPEPLELWATPPFEPALRQGALYARGARDDKGELIARLAAVDAVRAANGGALPCGVTFVVEGEEESGSPHIADFVRQHKEQLSCQGAIWEEGGIDSNGRPMIYLGCRGVFDVELNLETLQRDAHSGNSHILPNAAWRLVRLLECLKGEDERIRIPGFYDAVQPPGDLDLKLLEAMPSYEEFYRQVYGVHEFVLGRKGKKLEQAVFEPALNIQGISTGYQGEGGMTVIPARATVKLDFRLVPEQDPPDILAKLRAHLDTQGFGDVQIKQHGGMMWPARTSPDDPLVDLTARAGADVYGKPALKIPMAGGSTPMYAFIQPLGGIPVVTAGVGYWNNRAHAPDEHVRQEDFLNATRQIARILDGFARLPGQDAP